MIDLDANVVIRLVEGDRATRMPIEARLAPLLGKPNSFISSRLSRLECRSKPLRAGDLATLAQFETFFSGIELQLLDIDGRVVEAATDLRAKYNLKTPDAIHLASAIVGNAEAFLTGDRGLLRCTELAVEVL